MHNPANNEVQGQPLTEAEHGIWLGQQLNIDSPFYNAAEVIDIRGPLSASGFGLALCQALAEAPALHRIFRETPDGPRQFFTSLKPNVEILDFSGEAHSAELAENWMLRDLERSVDLTLGPIYQQVLIKLADDHYLWYQRIHHIAADGFAFALFSQRVAEIYNSQMDNRDPGKPLGDYNAVLQDDHNYRNSPRRNTSRDFWLSRLPQSPRPISLSRSRAPIEQWPIRQSAEITTKAFSQLKDTAESLGSSWADLTTAAVAALIYQQTAADEIIIGLPVMGRMGTPALRLPAMVMNITPLRIATQGLITLQDWTQRIAAEQKICRPHHRYRYEHLRRDLNAVGGDKRLYGPVVNIMPFDRQLRFGTCRVAVRNLSAGPVEDISFAFVLQADNSLRFDIEANPKRYTEQQLATYQRAIFDLLSNPSQTIAVTTEPFSWLSGADLPRPLPTVLELFRAQVEKNAHATALVDGPCRLSYVELDEKARRFAAGLKNLEIQANDIVALALPRSEAAVVGCLGCLLIGAPYVFLDPEGPEKRNQTILQDAEPKIIVAENSRKSASIIGYGELLASAPISKNVEWQIPADCLAYLIYTSGSTGAPKGVMIGRHALAEFIAGAALTYGITHKDRVLQYAPLHFDASVEEIFVTLCQGATLVIRSESMLDSVGTFLNTCAEWDISVVDLPTAYWHELVFFCHSTGTPLPSNIHTLIIGGEAALPERVRQWHQLDTQDIRLLNTYGPSETTVVASCAQLYADQPISIGSPLAGRQLAVVDRQGRILKRGEAGELVVLGGGIGSGYKNMVEATAARFRELQFAWQTNKQSCYFTGDRALITPQGIVEYLGRLDAEIKISGHRINPVEIESAILSLGLARDVAVVTANGNSEQKSLTAFIVADDQNNLIDIQNLRQQLAAILPAPMLPTRLEHLPHLPQSAAGKVDRKALAALAAADAQHIVHDDLSPAEQLVIQIWQQVLGITAINRNDDFFMLGGQSLQTIQVANRLSAALQKNIAVTLLFEHPTVQQLALALSNQSSPAKTSPIKEIIDADMARFQVELSPASERQLKPLHDCKTVLLTGASGFVGAQLLYQLLLASDANVICLVRASSIDIAQEKITHALAKQNILLGNLHERIEILLADLERPGFDLSREAFHQLGHRCDAIFHNAANTSVMRDYQSLRAANLLCTQTLLRLAAIKGVPFHFISTIAVAPAAGLPEDYVAWHHGLLDGYQHTKWAAESSVQIAREQGYPAYTYRLARVVGDLKNAAVNDKDLVWNIAAASVRNGVFPQLPIFEPWTPVDVVTQAIVACAQNTPEQPVLNMMPTQTVALQHVGQWLRDAGYALEVVSVKDWCQQLAESPHPEDRAILGFFQQRSATGNAEISLPKIENQHTRELLKACNIDFPQISQDHFNAYLRTAIQQQLISAAKSPIFDKRGLYEPA